MGTMQHNALIIIGWDENQVRLAHEIAKRIERMDTDTTGHPMPQKLILTDVGVARYNGYCSFVVLPDGSKEGWGPSNLHNEMREELRAAVDKLNGSLTVVDISFGDLGDFINDKSVEGAEECDRLRAERDSWKAQATKEREGRQAEKERRIHISNQAEKVMAGIRKDWNEETASLTQQLTDAKNLIKSVCNERDKFMRSTAEWQNETAKARAQADKYRQETHRWASETRKQQQELDNLRANRDAHCEAANMYAGASATKSKALLEIEQVLGLEGQSTKAKGHSLEQCCLIVQHVEALAKGHKEYVEVVDDHKRQVAVLRGALKRLRSHFKLSKRAIQNSQHLPEENKERAIATRDKHLETIAQALSSADEPVNVYDAVVNGLRADISGVEHDYRRVKEQLDQAKETIESMHSSEHCKIVELQKELKEEKVGFAKALEQLHDNRYAIAKERDEANSRAQLLATALHLVRNHLSNRLNTLIDRQNHTKSEAVRIALHAPIDRTGQQLENVNQALSGNREFIIDAIRKFTTRTHTAEAAAKGARKNIEELRSAVAKVKAMCDASIIMSNHNGLTRPVFRIQGQCLLDMIKYLDDTLEFTK